MNKPNIFNYAPSELSQDAFICWLLSWSNPEVMTLNTELHMVSRRLLQAFFNKHNKSIPANIEKYEVRKQYQNIDILVIINDSVLIPIEDKIHSREHSDQLTRYIQLLKEEGHEDQNILPIYLQTGEQGDYKKVQESGFMLLARAELLNILKTGANTNNDILNDYIVYLEEIEHQVQSFMHLDLDEWNWYSWQGFYNYLQTNLGDGEWDYVPNASGGFLGFWWHGNGDDECDQYLQLEESKLCFKIAVDEKSRRTDLKWKWHERFLNAAEGSPISVVKPVLRNGNFMTVAVLDGDYRRANKDGKIDLEKTLDILREVQRIYDKAESI